MITMIAAMKRRMVSAAGLRGATALLRVLLVLATLTAALPSSGRAADNVSAEEAHAIGVQAYVYLYSLVTMDITRRQFTNVEHAQGIRAPMNEFDNIAAYPSATMREVVRPNF